MGIKLYNSTKNQLKDIILKSSLDDEQKKLWQVCIDRLSGDEAGSILEVLQDDIKNLYFLTKNLQEKMEVMRTKDSMMLRKIIKDEEKFVGVE